MNTKKIQSKKIQRSNQQNKAIHLWFEQIAQELNDNGYEQKLTIGTIDVPWTKESVKWMFKKIARYQFNKGHTSKLTTKELGEVAETLNRMLAEQGRHVAFPSIDQLITNEYE